MAGLTPRFVLRLGGLRAHTDHPAGGPTSFVVDRSLDVPADGLRVRLAQRGDVAPGDPAELDLGDNDGVERVFTGTVAEVRPRAGNAEVFAVGAMLGLLELRVSALYQEQRAGDVARDLIRRAGLDAGTVQDGISLPRFAVERRLPAHPQLRALGHRLGFDLFATRHGRIDFRGLGKAASPGTGGLGGAVGAAAGAAAALLGGGGPLAYGQHLLATRAAARPDPKRSVVVGGESPMSGQGEDKSFWLTARDAEYQDAAGDGAPLLVLDPLARTKDMAGRFAAGYLTGLGRSRRQLRVTVTGRPDLELGDRLDTVDAPDALLDAGGFVQAIRHRLGTSAGFLTEATVVVEDAA